MKTYKTHIRTKWDRTLCGNVIHLSTVFVDLKEDATCKRCLDRAFSDTDLLTKYNDLKKVTGGLADLVEKLRPKSTVFQLHRIFMGRYYNGAKRLGISPSEPVKVEETKLELSGIPGSPFL